MIASLKTLRFHNWWIAKIPPLLSFAYAVILLRGLDISTIWLDLVLLIVWMIGAAAFGHYINDIFDLQDDLQAGKENRTAGQSTIVKFCIAVALAAVALLPWILLPRNNYNSGLVISHLLIFLVYSAPPIRLKERGVLAVFADAVYAHVIPGLVVLFTLLPYVEMEHLTGFILLFAGWQFLVGCRNILNHHIDDYENDMISNTTTTATIYGDAAIKNVVKRFFFPLEVLVLLGLFYVLPSPFTHLIWFYLFYIVYTFNREVTFLKEKLTDEVIIKGRYDYLSGILLNEFYEKWLPLIILVWLTMQDAVFGILLAIHVVLFGQLILTFKKDIYFIIYLFYEIVRQSFFAIQKPIKHFFLSVVPRIRNLTFWKIKIAFIRSKNWTFWFIKTKSFQFYWFIKRNSIRTYWKITVFFRRTYWAWIRLYRNHIVRIAWIFIKFYYRVEYKLWKMFYKPLKDRFSNGK